MNKQTSLQAIMIGLLLAGSYLGVLRMMVKRNTMQRALPLAAAILLVLFGLLAVTMVYASSLLGTGPVLLALLVLVVLATICGTVFYLVENFRELNLGMLAIFVVYLLALAYVTLLSRNTTGDHTTSLLRLDLLSSALRTHSLKPMKHIFLNAALFMPLGFLLPHIDPENLDDVTCPLLLSLTLTILIETTQMMLNLGQADLTDIVSNVLGGLLGYVVYWLLSRWGFSIGDRED